MASKKRSALAPTRLSLKDARKLRDDAKELLVKGIDPTEQRREAQVESAVAEKELAETFECIAREWFSRYAPGLPQTCRKTHAIS